MDKTLITVAGKPAAAAPASAITLKPMTVVGETVQDPNSPYNQAYEVTNTSTATKTVTPVMETPISIQTVTKQVMRDQQVTRIAKALENIRMK